MGSWFSDAWNWAKNEAYNAGLGQLSPGQVSDLQNQIGSQVAAAGGTLAQVQQAEQDALSQVQAAGAAPNGIAAGLENDIQEFGAGVTSLLSSAGNALGAGVGNVLSGKLILVLALVVGGIFLIEDGGWLRKRSG